MSEAHSSSPPRDLRTDEHVEGSDPAANTGGSSDDAATLSYNAFEPTLQATQDLATGHVTQELNVGGDPAEWSGSAEAIHAKGNGTASHSLSSLLSGSGSEENRQKVATQPVINAAGAFWHGTDHYISQGSTLTTTSKEYYSSSDISQRSQASVLHNVQYHSPLEQLQQRRGQQLVVPHSRPELVSEPSIGAWSDPEHTPELARQSPTEALWSTRGHFSSSSESNMSPPTTARIIGREVSSLSNLSSHSHYSERSTEHSEDATPPRRSNTTSTNRILDREISSLSTLSSRTHYSEQSTNHTAAQVTPLQPSSTPSDGHVVHSSQGSIPQESFETRPEPPQTPAARKPMYVQGTFADELTPEMLKQSEEDIVWSSSPSKRAAERHRRGRRLEASPVSPLTRATLRRQSGRLPTSPQTVLRSSPRQSRRKYTILFTGVEIGPSLTRDKNLIDHLGGTIVEDWHECSHLVTEEVRNTIRCLCVIAAGKPVVSLEWIRACRSEERFVDETPYLIRPLTSHPVFRGKRLFLTEQAAISKSDFRELVAAGHGKVLQQEPSEYHKDTLIVGISGHHDKQHMRLKALNYHIMNKSELIETIVAVP